MGRRPVGWLDPELDPYGNRGQTHTIDSSSEDPLVPRKGFFDLLTTHSNPPKHAQTLRRSPATGAVVGAHAVSAVHLHYVRPGASPRRGGGDSVPAGPGE
jgi:hypothetical protein